MILSIFKIGASKYLELSVWILSLAVIFGWSAWPMAGAIFATRSLHAYSKSEIEQGSENARLEIQRSIQKHYLDYGVYIPLEDIVFTDRLIKSNGDLEAALVKICGVAPLAVWVPLVLRVPYIGERSFEWCWKPSLAS